MNILLVDDDRFVLGALNQNMNWETLGFKEVYSASNITQAKEVIKDKPIEILITDIDMPQGSGIDLLTWVREENYDIQTIFLTNYAEFNFAQKAIALQSFGYYLKPIEFDKLSLIVKKAIQKVEDTKKAKNAASISTAWEDIKESIAQHFWNEFLKQERIYTTQELSALLVKNHLTYNTNDQFITILFDLFTITLSEQNVITNCCHFPNKFASEFKTAFYEIFNRILSPNDIIIERNPASGSFIAIINCIQTKPESLLAKLNQYCEKLIFHMNKKYGVSLSCYMGLPVTFQTFHDGLDQLKSMSENIIECRNKVFMLSAYLPIEADYTLPNLKLLDEYLQLEKHTLFIEYCEDYLSLLSSSNQLNYNVLASFQIDMIQLIYSFLKERGILAHKLIQGKTNDTLLEISLKSIESMIVYISYLVNTSLDYVAFSACDKSVASIICEYIDMHFAEDINRNSLAEIVYLDPDYTAKLFKRETGCSLINYIIKKRIDTAKDLLIHTDLSVNLISDKIGYGNYSYFTKLFKKVVGVTPMDYRRTKQMNSL